LPTFSNRGEGGDFLGGRHRLYQNGGLISIITLERKARCYFLFGGRRRGGRDTLQDEGRWFIVLSMAIFPFIYGWTMRVDICLLPRGGRRSESWVQQGRKKSEKKNILSYDKRNKEKGGESRI